MVDTKMLEQKLAADAASYATRYAGEDEYLRTILYSAYMDGATSGVLAVGEMIDSYCHQDNQHNHQPNANTKPTDHFQVCTCGASRMFSRELNAWEEWHACELCVPTESK